MSDSELIEVFDSNGQSLGVKTRAKAHQDKDWHQLVFVMSARLDDDGSARGLFQLRSLPGDPFQGQIDLLAAGHVLAGESTAQAAIRECAEEAGIQLANDELQLLGNNTLSLEFGVCRNVMEYFYLAARTISLNEVVFSEEAQTFIEIKLSDFMQLLNGEVTNIGGLVRCAEKPTVAEHYQLTNECLALYSEAIRDNFRQCAQLSMSWLHKVNQ